MKMCRGFTLLELMVTIAVVAILASIGIPSFVTLIQNNRVSTQTNELVTTLNFARSEAIKRGRVVEVAVADANIGWAATVTFAPGTVDESILRIVDRQGSNVRILAGDTISFGPTGAPDGGATFNLEPGPNCSGDKRRQIAIGISGQIRTTRQSCES